MFWRGFCEGGEGLERGAALCLGEDGGHGVDAGDAVSPVALEFEDGQRAELRHAAAVLLGKVEDGFLTGSLLDTGFAAGEEERRGEAFEVPLEGALDGLVEVVDVEAQSAVGGAGEGAEVGDVGVAAELGDQAGVGMSGEVGCHDGHRAAEEAEGAGGHPLALDGDQRGQAAALGFSQQSERVRGARGGGKGGVSAAGELFARGDAKGAAGGVVEWCGGSGHGVTQIISVATISAYFSGYYISLISWSLYTTQ